jgi:FkbM family methyltransferase
MQSFVMNTALADFENKYVYEFKCSPDVEQSLVRDFFNHKLEGFFVDVGANDPFLDSQTYHLEGLGWNGLLIEPLPNYVEQLKEKRKGKVIQYACSSPENHNKVHKMIVAGVHSTLNDDPIAIGAVSSDSINVTCRTLDSILEENKVPIGFDFISIDIEGHEMEMFKGFSLSGWMPKLVLLEDHVINHQKHKYMLSHGYQILLRTGLNSWYVPCADGYKLSFSARLEFVRKYWLGLPFRKIQYAK